MTVSSAAAPSTIRHARILLAVFGLFALITCSVLWYVASPAVAPIYDGLRTIETAGLWRLTNWSQTIRSVPRGQPHDFYLIYVSSIPFGLVCSVLIATIAASAYDKRRTRHLYALIVPKGGVLTEGALRERLQPLLPHLGAPKAAPPAGWDDQTAENPFARITDLRDPVQVSAVLQGLPLPVARLLFLALTAAEKGDKVIGGLRPSTVEAEAWRSTQQVTAKPSAAAAAVLTSAVGLIITGRGGSQVTSDSQALAAQDAILQIPGTLAEMLLELIDHARQNGSLPASSIRWVRWTMPELAAGLLGARPLTAV